MMHYIMNKNIPTIRIEDALIINKDMCPRSLQIGRLSNDKIYKWLSNRALPLSRKNADKVYQVMGLPREDYLGLMYVTHALSINDNYWVASDKELGKIGYDQISIFKNSFNNAMYLVALKGAGGFTIQEPTISPEFTGQGTYPKCFIRRQDGIYICKSQTNIEISYEILASYIGRLLGVNTASYTYEVIHGCNCSVSKILSNEHSNWETAFDMTEHTEYIAGKIPQEFALDLLGRKYSDIIIFDALILNDDRHMKNWAFEFDAETNNLIGMAPSYDYNKAFRATDKTYSQLVFDGNRRYNLLRAAKHIYSTVGTDLNIQRLLDNLNGLPEIINKYAIYNRVEYILGHSSSTNDCY